MTKTTFQRIKIIFILTALTSCEYHHESLLQNQTGQEINLIIQFDKKTFENDWGGRPYIPFLKQYGISSEVKLERFDSVNLISHYKIEDNGVFSIEQGVGGKKEKPRYEIFKTFKVIFKNDSVTITDQKEFDKYFISEDYHNYIWTLK